MRSKKTDNNNSEYRFTARGLTCALLIFCMIFSLCACGKNKNDAAVSDSSGDAENAVSSGENSGEEQDPQSGDDGETSDDEGKDSMSYDEYVKIYEDFLNNEEPVYFSWLFSSDNLEMCDWANCGFTEVFDKSVSCSFSEFMEKSCEAYFNGYEKRVYPDDISYSIIDCGADGTPELALNIAGQPDSMIDFTDTWFIKYIDGKLQVILLVESGYRTQFDVNEYGYYQYGGSSGAATWDIEHAYITPDGTAVFDYGEENNSSAWALYIPDNSEYETVAEEQGIDENIETEQFYFEKFEGAGDYTEFQKSSMWIYYELDDKYERVEDNDDIYKEGSPYRIFWDSTGLPLNTEDEIEEAKAEHSARIGASEKIINAKSAEWTPLTKKQSDMVYSWKPEEADTVVLDEPSWDYYYWGYEPEPYTRLGLEVENKTPNDIIDEDVWFAAMGMEEPDPLNFEDDVYSYRLYGEDPDGLAWYPYMMDICDKETGDTIYTLDFSNYYKPEDYNEEEDSLVEEAIHWAVAKDGVLYVSTFHSTYASTARQNGYITAFDMNNGFSVLWRTEPLTCNAHNFIVTDDAIICGYGFTAEDDFVYVLDRESGLRVSQTKVKTSPEWFCLDGDRLFVRCYDTDYMFNVSY